MNDERSFGRICNPTALSISIFNAKKDNNSRITNPIPLPVGLQIRQDTNAINNGTQPVRLQIQDTPTAVGLPSPKSRFCCRCA